MFNINSPMRQIKKLFLPIFAAVLIIAVAFFVAKFSFLSIVIFLGLTAVGGIFININWGIYLLLGSLIAGQLIRLPLPFSEDGALLSDVLTGLVLLAWILRKILLKEKFIFPSLTFPIFGFIAVAVVSLFVNRVNVSFGEFLSSGFYLIRWIEYVGVYFVISDLYGNMFRTGFLEKEITAKEWLILKIILVGGIISVLGFIQLKIFPDFSPMVKYGWDPHYDRLLSTWFDPNFLGGFFIVLLIIGLAMFWYYFLETRQVFRKFKIFILSFLVFIIFIAMVLTYSRSGYIAFAAGILAIILVYALSEKDKNILLKFVVAGIMAVVLAVTIFSAFPRVWQRIQGAKNLDDTARARIESWKIAWGAIEDNYIIGVGYNTLRYTQSISISGLRSASGFDSSILTIWLTTGLAGLIFYLWILAKTAKKSFLEFYTKKNPILKRAIGLGVFGAIFALLVHSMFVNSLLYPHIMLSFWMIVGLLE